MGATFTIAPLLLSLDGCHVHHCTILMGATFTIAPFWILHGCHPSQSSKHPSSMTRWLNEGVLLEREDPTFRKRINHLDRQISAAARNNE
jgi:hypothetical protein